MSDDASSGDATPAVPAYVPDYGNEAERLTPELEEARQ